MVLKKNNTKQFLGYNSIHFLETNFRLKVFNMAFNLLFFFSAYYRVNTVYGVREIFYNNIWPTAKKVEDPCPR